MAPVPVTGEIRIALGKKDSSDWHAWSPVYRQGTNGEVITTRGKEFPVQVVAGHFTAQLEPGVCVIENPDGQQYTVLVPDEPADLWTLIEQAVGVPPDTGADLLDAAVERFIENNEGYPWSGVAGKPSALAAGGNQPNGFLVLGSDGKADASQLPSYVDDVLEFANQAAFPGTGTTGKIYVALDTGDSFRWSGSAYARISDRVTASGITDSTATGRAVLKGNIFSQLARNPDALVAGTVTRDSNGAATSAPVVWPDGSPGTYTATTLSSAFPGAVDAYTITYGSPVTATYTQPAVTRDSVTGAVTVVPAITVS